MADCFFELLPVQNGRQINSLVIVDAEAHVLPKADLGRIGSFPNFSLMRTTSNEGFDSSMLLYKTLAIKVNLWPTHASTSGGVCMKSYCFRRISALFPSNSVPRLSKTMNSRVYVPSLAMNGILYLKDVILTGLYTFAYVNRF
ncbi:unnamed protein product [Urochloa humidicola]